MKKIGIVSVGMIGAAVLAVGFSAHTFADTTIVEKITATIPVSCTILSANNTHTETLNPGTTDINIGNKSTEIYPRCNDAGGYIIYAIGYSNDTDGNTRLISSNGSNYINTGASGSDSYWAMKVEKKSGNTDSTLVINNTYTDFASAPGAWIYVARKSSGTVVISQTTGLTVTYKAYISPAQPAGTYTGKVKYILFHPSNSMDPTTTLEQAYALAGKSKVQNQDPLTNESGEYYTMQDMNHDICQAATVTGEASQLRLVDLRDHKLYWATKLEDGNCWMTQNLDLDLSTSQTLTSNDTDLNLFGEEGYDTDNGYTCSNSNPDCSGGVISFTPERSTLTANNLSTWPIDWKNPYSYDPGLTYPDENVPQSTAGYHGLAGNYYNWTAAIASNNSNSYMSDGEIAANSICPKGWRLAKDAWGKNEEANEYGVMLYAQGVTAFEKTSTYATDGFVKIQSSPLYFVRSGMVSVGGIRNVTEGWYWSSANATNIAYHMVIYNNQVITDSQNNRHFGSSIRCMSS